MSLNFGRAPNGDIAAVAIVAGTNSGRIIATIYIEFTAHKYQIATFLTRSDAANGSTPRYVNVGVSTTAMGTQNAIALEGERVAVGYEDGGIVFIETTDAVRVVKRDGGIA